MILPRDATRVVFRALYLVLYTLTVVFHLFAALGLVVRFKRSLSLDRPMNELKLD